MRSKISADIILTTLKPQLKNVTAGDVASSLYFFHFNTEDDARIFADHQENARSGPPKESNVVEHKPLPRKPLSETARLSLDLNRSIQPSFPRHETSPDRIHRKPLTLPARSDLDLDQSETSHDPGQSSQIVGSSTVGQEFQHKETASRDSPNQPPEQARETVQRRPLGPRPLLSESSIERKPHSGVQGQPFISGPRMRQAVPSKVSSDSARFDPANEGNQQTTGSPKSFSFTIIRRDPSSGSQWNIGSIAGDAHRRGMKAMSNSKKSYFDISVHLTTPGYTLLRNSQIPAQNINHSQLPITMSESSTTSSDLGFDRQVFMEGSSFFERASKQHKRSQSDFSGTLSTSGNATAVQIGAKSRDHVADIHDSNSKGYVFLSPWGGRCKFSTGGGGRSLRCKHTLPDSLSSSNAIFDSAEPAVVSELRFNLPHSTVFKFPTARNVDGVSSESGRFSIPKFGHIRDKPFQGSRPPLPHPTSYAAMYTSDDEEPPPLPDMAYADSNDEQDRPPISVRSHNASSSPSGEDDERLDLSIGREEAGGGNRGKRAKLGKLIIYDEGFKMLDLVVAANMGIWWSIFDNR